MWPSQNVGMQAAEIPRKGNLHMRFQPSQHAVDNFKINNSNTLVRGLNVMNAEPSHPGLLSLTPLPSQFVPTRDNRSLDRRFDPARSSIEDRLKQRQRHGEH
jgi:hypothetical protein